MTANIMPVKYDSTTKTHTPMIEGDAVDSSVIPKSARPGNELQLLGDGLYIGSGLLKSAYYVSSTGQDVPTAGDEVTPMQTLDYCLQQLVLQSQNQDRIEGSVTIVLKSGEIFALTQSYTVSGSVRIAFYGDPNYGDYDGPIVGTGAFPYNMADLIRPIIGTRAVNVVPRSVTGLRLVDKGTLRLSGVQINFPARPFPAPQLAEYGNLCDFATAVDYSDATLILEGVIANMTDANAVYGLGGVQAKATMHLTQFASQLQVLGTTLGDVTAPAQSLLARPYFFKMYTDYPGNNQQAGALVPSTGNSSSGSGFMKMSWSEVQAQTVVGSSTNLATFPLMFNVNYGMRNYFTNLIRDQQSRPLNVQASALF